MTFVVQLGMDAREHPEEWANTTITDYLGQMASWIDDCHGFKDDIDWEKWIIEHLQKSYIWERFMNRK